MSYVISSLISSGRLEYIESMRLVPLAVVLMKIGIAVGAGRCHHVQVWRMRVER